MKKFILVIMIVFILCSFLILPAAAVVGGEFDGQTNLIQTPGLDNISTADFIPSPGAAAIENQPFFNVDLDPSTTYTFISTGGGSDRLLIAPKVNVDGQSTVFGFDSPNYLFLNDDVQFINGITFRSNSDGSITLNGTSGNTSTVYYLTNYYIPSGTYYYKVFSDRSLNGSTFYSSYSNEDTGVSAGDYGSGRQLTSSGNRFTFAFTVGPNLTFDNVKVYPGVYESMPSEWTPGYSSVFFVNDNVSLVSFTTSSNLSGQYVLGLKDPSEPSAAGSYFSRLTSDSNSFYLIEGDYTYSDVVDNITSQIGDQKYSEGYSEGYRLGEYEGASSGNIFSNVLMTIFSAPMTLINNTLNFEILGVNVLMLVRIVLTILLVAFVITHLKGRE